MRFLSFSGVHRRVIKFAPYKLNSLHGPLKPEFSIKKLHSAFERGV